MPPVQRLLYNADLAASNPAGQIIDRWRSNDTAYAWDGHQVADRSYAANGLNQYTQVGTSGYCYDANG